MEQVKELLQGAPFWVQYLVLGVVMLLVARKSQVDAWAELNPRLAGFLKILRGVSFDTLIIRQGLWLIFVSRLPPEPKLKSKGLPPGVATLMLVLSCGLICASPALLTACSASQATKAQMVEAGKALAFNSAATALVLLDKAEADRIDAIKTPTAAQVEQAKKNVTKLRAARDALQVVRDWMLGQSGADGPALLKDTLAALQSVADSIDAEGGVLPVEVDQMLKAGRAFL